MGHLRLQKFPVSRRWRHVLALLESGASTAEIASASAKAVETVLKKAALDPVYEQGVWILLRAPLAARGPDFEEDLRKIGVELDGDASLFGITSAIAETL